MLEVSIIIPTKNAGVNFHRVLDMIYNQEFGGKFEVIIVDSGSTDETIDIAKSFPVRVVSIKPQEFSHGGSRNLGASLAYGTYLVFLTHDAIPATNKWLFNLIRNFEDPGVAGVYGRQIPKEATKPMEYFFLTDKYPLQYKVKQSRDGKMNMDLIFFSDVNSALRKSVWQHCPYDENLIRTEDWEWAKRILTYGYKIVYEPEGAVYHSHNINLSSLFQKYFDIGVSLTQFTDKECTVNRFTSEGLRYFKREITFLISNRQIKFLPYAIVYDLTKFLGILCGKREKWLPRNLKKRLSENKLHWEVLGGR